jgi:hypothetical protein
MGGTATSVRGSRNRETRNRPINRCLRPRFRSGEDGKWRARSKSPTPPNLDCVCKMQGDATSTMQVARLPWATPLPLGAHLTHHYVEPDQRFSHPLLSAASSVMRKDLLPQPISPSSAISAQPEGLPRKQPEVGARRRPPVPHSKNSSHPGHGVPDISAGISTTQAERSTDMPASVLAFTR